MQTVKTEYENAKKERETLFALIAEKEQQLAQLKAEEERVVLAYQKAQADRSIMSRAMFEGDRIKDQIEKLTEKEEAERKIQLRKEEIEKEEQEISERKKALEDKEAIYTECIRKKERLTEIYHQGIELERQEKELKEELRAAGMQVVKMQSVEDMRIRYGELLSEYGKVAASKELEPQEIEEKLEQIKKEAESEKATMELLLEQMGIRILPGIQPPSISQFREHRDTIETALNEVLEQIDVLVQEQEICLTAREKAETLAKEIESEREALAMKAEKCHRIQSEQVKLQHFVQEILLGASYVSSQEAEKAMNHFVQEQESKKEEIVRAEQEYEEWDRTFKNEAALLDQLYGQRLIQMQKEQLAMEEYNKSLRNS